MDYQALAELLFPDVTETPEQLEARFPQRDLPEGAVVSRMAPSPTGFVHLGNLVQGTISERMTHQSGGVLYLRVEDTDAKREIPGAVEVLINTLKFYNINFDEGATVDGDDGAYGPYRQRQRAAIYHVYAKKLVSEGKAYPCFCTEDELSALREKQEANKETTGYYGKYAVWRDRPMEDIQAQLAAGNPWVLRFRSEGSIDRQFKFDDLVKGKLTITENNVDHVLLKSDGIPTYHFAHAVDDHLMRTTHVVRGDEWLPSLPFHIQLFQALGFKLPKYVHIGPLMKMDGSSKRKLSKRKDPELALTYYKAEGFPIPSVREYIMTVLNSNFEDWRRANPDADIESFKFSPKKLNPAGSLFDYAKLVDVSKNVISRMSAEDVYAQLLEWAKEFDTDFAADLTIMEEGSEFIERFTHKDQHQWPMFTSCCPGWVRFVKSQYPELTDNLSTAKSPQQMFGAVAKSYFAEKVGIDPKRLFVVSIMPCVSKKSECVLPTMKNDAGDPDVDVSITTRELNIMMRANHIEPKYLPEEEFDSPLGSATGAAVVFGTTGGVMDAALRSAYFLITGKNPDPDAFTAVRGTDGWKEATFNIPGAGDVRVAVVSSLGKARKLIEAVKRGDAAYDFVEVMACPGGCAGGGGQPIHDGTELAEDRGNVLWRLDQGELLRFSHENPDVKALYKDYLGAPLGEKSHHLLHTDHNAWQMPQKML